MGEKGAETLWYRFGNGSYYLQGPGSEKTTLVGSREEIQREGQANWTAEDVELIASRRLTRMAAEPPPHRAVTRVTQTLMKEFQTRRTLLDLANHIEDTRPDDEDALTFVFLLRKVADAMTDGLDTEDAFFGRPES
jgi:hypothetical protein